MIIDARSDTLLYINDLSCSFAHFSINNNHFEIDELYLRGVRALLTKYDSSKPSNLERFLMNFNANKDTSSTSLIIKPENIELENISIAYEDSSIKFMQSLGSLKGVLHDLDIQRNHYHISSLSISAPITRFQIKEEIESDTISGIVFPSFDLNLF